MQRKVKILCKSAKDSRIIISTPPRYKAKILNSSFWVSFVPNIELQQITKGKAKYHIHLESGSQFEVNTLGVMVIIKTTFSEKQIKDIIAISGYLLERQRQESRIYSIHGSLIAQNGSAVAFIGGMSGVGKTSLALHAESECHEKWVTVSDEKFLLDGRSQEIIGGIKIISTKQNKNIKDQKNKIVENIPRGDLKLKLILFPILTTENTLKKFRYTFQKLKWHLYEEASRDIRLVNGLVNNFSLPLMSLDTEKISRLRLRDVQKISKRIPAYFIQGNALEIYKFGYSRNFVTTPHR